MPNSESSVLLQWPEEPEFMISSISALAKLVESRRVGPVALVRENGRGGFEAVVIHPFPTISDILEQVQELRSSPMASQATHVAYKILGDIDDPIDPATESVKALRMGNRYPYADRLGK